jgi:hypothetical protein
MNKIIVSGFVAIALFGASIASAQTYYGSCLNFSSDLSYGQKGTNVTQLQNFLVGQNYPGSGSWMVTGYFGQATVAAVRDFQQAHGLPTTGAVDSSTRAAISNVTCGLPGLGGSGYVYNNNAYSYNSYGNYTTAYPYSYSSTYTYPYNNYNGYGSCGTYPYYSTCSATYGSTPHLTSLSANAVAVGSSVTIYGTGFDPNNNTVYVGGTTLSSIPSINSTSLVFTVPANVVGVVSISVGSSYGISNALTLNVGNYGYQSGGSSYYSCLTGQGGYGYSYNCPQNTGTPIVSYLSPTSGAVNTYVTVFGSGFSTTGNSVHFGNGVIGNIQSQDGYTLSFQVPTSLSGYGYQPIGLGTYNVSVSNSAGVTSNAVQFTITSLSQTSTPSISAVTGPTTLGIGVSGTWTVIVQNPGSSYLTTSVNWGDSSTYGNQSSPQTTAASGQNTLTFTHAYAAGGTYTVIFTVQNGSGQQNTSTATVYVNGTGTTGSVYLTSLSPTSGPVGTTITIQGSGFDPYNNTVHFGTGGMANVSSQNGIIRFTVPSYLSPCSLGTSGVCALYAQQVTPGSYAIYVTSPSGTSNTLTFQVQ